MFFHAFFFFNDTATTEIYTLSLHDALPISVKRGVAREGADAQGAVLGVQKVQLGDAVEVEQPRRPRERSEEHTSELQSPCNLVCRLLLEKKNRYACLRCSRPIRRQTPMTQA